MAKHPAIEASDRLHDSIMSLIEYAHEVGLADKDELNLPDDLFWALAYARITTREQLDAIAAGTPLDWVLAFAS